MPRTLPESRPSTEAAGPEELRRMVLLQETADVLDARARRSSDPAQIAVLLRRAEHRRREAAHLRERLAAQGAALPTPHAPESPAGQAVLVPRSPAGHRRRG